MLGWVRLTSGKDDLILVTEQGQALRFHETAGAADGPSGGRRPRHLAWGRAIAVRQHGRRRQEGRPAGRDAPTASASARR